MRDGHGNSATGRVIRRRWVGLVVANFIWLFPILDGLPITAAHWDAELWLPSWRA